MTEKQANKKIYIRNTIEKYSAFVRKCASSRAKEIYIKSPSNLANISKIVLNRNIINKAKSFNWNRIS